MNTFQEKVFEQIDRIVVAAKPEGKTATDMDPPFELVQNGFGDEGHLYVMRGFEAVIDIRYRFGTVNATLALTSDCVTKHYGDDQRFTHGAMEFLAMSYRSEAEKWEDFFDVLRRLLRYDLTDLTRDTSSDEPTQHSVRSPVRTGSTPLA